VRPAALRSVKGEVMTGTLTPVIAIAVISGEIDITTCGAMRDTLTAALRSGPDLIVDLSGVTFIDCSGIRVLVAARNQAVAGGGTLTLRAPSAAVRRVTGILGLDEVLPVVG
jgi:anti-anti-sigma factor